MPPTIAAVAGKLSLMLMGTQSEQCLPGPKNTTGVFQCVGSVGWVLGASRPRCLPGRRLASYLLAGCLLAG